MTYKQFIDKIIKIGEEYEYLQKFYEENPNDPKTIYRSPHIDKEIFTYKIRDVVDEYFFEDLK